MSESVPPTSSEILYKNTSNQVAGNSELTFDTTYQGTRLDTANVLVSNRSILSGNVGIQTATPRGSLEVTGATILAAQGSELTGTHQFGLNGTYDSLSLVSPVGLGLNGTTSIFFGLNSLIYYPVARIVAVDNGNYSGSLAFQIGNGEQLYQQMRLTMDGVVTGNAAFLYKTVSIQTPGTNIGLTFPSINGTTSIIEVYVILQRTADTSFANMVKFTVFLGAQLYVTNITVQAIGSSTIIIARNGVVVSGTNVIVSFTDPGNDYTASINYMIYGPATAFLTKITYILNASLIFTVPGAPSGITGIPGDQSVVLEWNKPQNGGSPIIGYTVLDQSGNSVNPSGSIDASGNFSSTLIADASGTLLITDPKVVSDNPALTITGLLNGTQYTFRIKAMNSVGYSGTNSITRTPAVVPNPPLSVLATPENQSATVSWSPPSYNGGSAITSYTVIASPSPSSGPPSVTVTGLTTSVIRLTNGTSYTFQVYATNSIGPSLYSSPSAAIIPFTVPDPPTGVSATAGTNSAIVTWTAPGNNQGYDIISYTIISTTGGTSTNTLYSQAIAVSSVNTTTVSGLTPGAAYIFSVFVTTSKGNSATSGSSISVVIPGPPTAPTNVSAISGVTSATVSWNAPLSDGNSAVTLYTITSNPGSFTAISSIITPTEVSGLTPGDSYTFTVVATNAIGNSPSSLPSNSITVLTAPGPPTNLTALAGTGSVTLTWLSPANTGGVSSLSYKIYNGVNVYNPASSTFDTDSPLLYSSTTPSAILTGLSNGVSYSLTIKTVNPAGLSTSAAFPIFIPGLTPASAPIILYSNSTVAVDWLGIELLFYYPLNYPYSGGNPSLTINMPSDFLTNTIYYGRKIFTGLINGAVYGIYMRFNVGGTFIIRNFSGLTVPAKFTAWALGPPATSLGQSGSDYGIFVEGCEMGDTRYLFPR